MSLINEALKKAQASHGRPGLPLPLQGEPHASPHPPRRRHSYLFGFVVALLVVGLFSAAVTTFLVWQFLGTEDRPAAPPLVEHIAAAAAVAAPATVAPAATPAPEPVAEPVPEPVAVLTPVAAEPAPPDVVSLDQPVTAASMAAPAAATVPPAPALLDAETAKRLGELEIRGIMGLSRVLLHDLASGRSRAYRIGESVEGYPELVVKSISDSSVSFKDHAGSIHTKPF